MPSLGGQIAAPTACRGRRDDKGEVRFPAGIGPRHAGIGLQGPPRLSLYETGKVSRNIPGRNGGPEFSSLLATRNQRPTSASSPQWTTYYEAVRPHSIGRPARGCEYSDRIRCGPDCSAKGLAHGSVAKVGTCNCHISGYKCRAKSALPLHERCR